MYISNVNSASIKLKSIENETVAVDDEVTIYSENELILLYFNKGASDYIINGDTQKQEMKKRDLVILNPGNALTFIPVRKIEWIKVVLTGVLFTSSLDINSANELFIINDQHSMIRRYLELALIENNHRFRGSDIILRKLLESVMVHILRNSELSIKDSTIQTKNSDIDKVQQYIRENYHEKITLDQLSELVDINKYYLIRLFKQKTGLSPIDYLIHVRLEQAENLLKQTDLTISKISDMVGFHSPSHFSKTFKESNHLTPSQFRKNYRQEIAQSN
ncbi:AraC family transcriptional regulator [Suicoccus acidiformans]|uniref:AraC family transcriptional regulator n=1 Tax=Suicoccus acidiformans TaxID=2036206 RepID=A0A347WNG4_9LACT|nr:AraC family transcriptional regulator [Suicoccus acidiformans]AXY26621.1 AraC family transcriptional regulator [Suicoccus acidiformans]